MVGGKQNLWIVLDHDQRIPRVAQSPHHADDALQVARMQSNRGFIEHEEGARERGTQRGREVDALYLASRERSTLAVQGQVPQSNRLQITQSGADFCQQQDRGLVQWRWQG